MKGNWRNPMEDESIIILATIIVVIAIIMGGI